MSVKGSGFLSSEKRKIDLSCQFLEEGRSRPDSKWLALKLPSLSSHGI